MSHDCTCYRLPCGAISGPPCPACCEALNARYELSAAEAGRLDRKARREEIRAGRILRAAARGGAP